MLSVIGQPHRLLGAGGSPGPSSQCPGGSGQFAPATEPANASRLLGDRRSDLVGRAVIGPGPDSASSGRGTHIRVR
jgi:hypothetical protein